MKTYLKPLMMLLISSSVFFTACEEEEESMDENPDPRTLLVGDYVINDYQVHVYDNVGAIDSNFTVVSKPVITLKADKNISADELRIGLHEFIEETMTEIYPPSQTGASLIIDINDPQGMIADQVAGREYKIKDFDFDLIFSDGVQSASYPHEFSGEGEFDKGKITLQFVMTITDMLGATTNYEGRAIGRKK